MHRVDEAVNQECSRIIDLCLVRYRWELLERDEFVRCAIGRLALTPELPARQAVFEVYILVLYEACSGAEGRARQERGYIELYAFLAAYAVRYYPEAHLDTTQRALEAIYRTFEHCRKPQSFLAFAIQKLRDAGRAEIRQTQRHRAISSTDEEGQPTMGAMHVMVAPDPDPLEQVAAMDFQNQLIACVRTFLYRHPRARQQFAALWMKYIDELDDHTISDRLGKSIAHIHVLRSRAITSLRKDPDWQQLAYEAGLVRA